MPATTASDQVLMFPIEIKPLCERIVRITSNTPLRPREGLLVPEPFPGARGTLKCEIPTGQPKPSRARLALLAVDLIYGRRDRSKLIGGGGRFEAPAVAHPPCHQSLAGRPGNHGPDRGVRFLEPADHGARTGCHD